MTCGNVSSIVASGSCMASDGALSRPRSSVTPPQLQTSNERTRKVERAAERLGVMTVPPRNWDAGALFIKESRESPPRPTDGASYSDSDARTRWLDREPRHSETIQRAR